MLWTSYYNRVPIIGGGEFGRIPDPPEPPECPETGKIEEICECCSNYEECKKMYESEEEE